MADRLRPTPGQGQLSTGTNSMVSYLSAQLDGGQGRRSRPARPNSAVRPRPATSPSTRGSISSPRRPASSAGTDALRGRAVQGPANLQAGTSEAGRARIRAPAVQVPGVARVQRGGRERAPSRRSSGRRRVRRAPCGRPQRQPRKWGRTPAHSASRTGAVRRSPPRTEGVLPPGALELVLGPMRSDHQLGEGQSRDRHDCRQAESIDHNQVDRNQVSIRPLLRNSVARRRVLIDVTVDVRSKLLVVDSRSSLERRQAGHLSGTN